LPSNYRPISLISYAGKIMERVRDRPFNLKGVGALWFFVSFRNLFSDNTRVRI
jgi:hypothetical protein